MAAIVWKGYVSFGLVSFPVKLYAAGRAEAVHFHMLHKKDLSRVKEVWYCAAEDKPIDRDEIVKGYESGKDNYIVVEDGELEAIAPATASTMDIVQFVKESEVDPIYFERSYYVAPIEEVTRPYALFLKALEDSGHYAIAKLAMHNREHIVLIRPDREGLVLHTLFYPGELHVSNRQTIPKKAEATKKELELAAQLIRQLSAPFKPQEFHDTYRENVEKLIEQKEKGEHVAKHPAKRQKAPVIDLMEALKKSLGTSEAARTQKAKTKRKRAA
ncbi:MAG TPA: Ku protein [Bryobacteraceae bacterium]|nr:Ku protein [Bryobacteraceae bacterium]